MDKKVLASRMEDDEMVITVTGRDERGHEGVWEERRKVPRPVAQEPSQPPLDLTARLDAIDAALADLKDVVLKNTLARKP